MGITSKREVFFALLATERHDATRGIAMKQRYWDRITSWEAGILFVIILGYGLLTLFFDIELVKLLFPHCGK